MRRTRIGLCRLYYVSTRRPERLIRTAAGSAEEAERLVRHLGFKGRLAVSDHGVIFVDKLCGTLRRRSKAEREAVAAVMEQNG